MHLRPQPAAPSGEPHTDGLSPFCPRFQYAIELIGRRWVGAVLRVLGSRPARFNEILAAVPNLSDRLLTERLRELEQAGVLERRVVPASPPYAEYRLTERGRALAPVVQALGAWRAS